MLAKYGLKENDAILYEKEDIFEELVKDYGSEVEYIAGSLTVLSPNFSLLCFIELRSTESYQFRNTVVELRSF